jgi:hypothetical protein
MIPEGVRKSDGVCQCQGKGRDKLSLIFASDPCLERPGFLRTLSQNLPPFLPRPQEVEPGQLSVFRASTRSGKPDFVSAGKIDKGKF